MASKDTRPHPTPVKVSAAAPRIVLRDEELVEALTKAAERQTRTRTHQAVHYIREGLIRDGLLDELGATDTILPAEGK